MFLPADSFELVKIIDFGSIKLSLLYYLNTLFLYINSFSVNIKKIYNLSSTSIDAKSW